VSAAQAGGTPARRWPDHRSVRARWAGLALTREPAGGCAPGCGYLGPDETGARAARRGPGPVRRPVVGSVAGLLLALAFLLSVLAAPLAAQEQPRRFDTVEDARVLIQVWRILDAEDLAAKIEAEVRQGRVVLRGTVADPDLPADLAARIATLDGVERVETRLELSTDVVERLGPVARRLQRQAEWLVQALPLVGVALGLWGAIAWLGHVIAARRWPWDRIAPNAFIAEVLRMVIRLAAVLAGAVIALDILGARALLGTLLGAAGILGLAVGFAVRDVVENFLASILLSLRSPFRPNDLIEVAGDTGRVVRLTARATILISPDGNQIRIPNATVFKSRIINYSRQPERRFTLRLPVAAGTDIAPAIARAQAALAAAPFVLDAPPPAVWLAEVGADGAATLEAAAWIDARATGFALARGEALRLVLQAFPGERVKPSPEAPAREQDAAIEGIAEAEAGAGEQLLDARTRDE